MSMLIRGVARTSARWAPKGVRTVTVESNASDYVAKRNAVKAHAQETTNLWRRISFYVCFPATIVTIAWVRNAEAEHAAHTEHLKAENDGHMPEVPAYDYLNKRIKPFPWGMNSLFFNPHVNKDMSNSEE